MKFTGTIDAWITSEDDVSFKDIVDMAKSGDETRAVGEMAYCRLKMSGCGWTKVGTATITVEMMDETDVNSAQMDVLKAELQNIRADNQRRENAILDRISKLSALTYEVSA
jgi:alkylated DNA nucleotide flippase Atl1